MVSDYLILSQAYKLFLSDLGKKATEEFSMFVN
jgi:hypothetical protein